MWTIKDNKEMTPEFHIIEERLQKDIIIQCKDKTTLQIEQQIAKEFKKIDFTKTPILIAIYERNQKNKNQIKEDTIYFISIDEIEALKKKIYKSSCCKSITIPTKYLHQGFDYIKEVFERI